MDHGVISIETPDFGTRPTNLLLKRKRRERRMEALEAAGEDLVGHDLSENKET